MKKRTLLTGLMLFFAAATIFAVPEWQPDTVYNKGDRVVFQDTYWEAQWWSQNNLPGGDGYSPWLEIYETPIREWKKGRIYTYGDKTIYNGKIWEAKWWTSGDTPADLSWNAWNYITDLTVTIVDSNATHLVIAISDSLEDTSFGELIGLSVTVPEGWAYAVSAQGPVHTDIVAVKNGSVSITAFAEQGELILQPEATDENVGFTGRCLDGDLMIADYFYNKNIHNKKPLILLGGSEGGKSWSSPYDTQNRRDLVKRGYACLSFAYFGLEGVSPSLENIPLELFETITAWFETQIGVDTAEYAVMGASKGAEFALMLASKYDEIKTVAALVPSAYVFQGIGEGYASSWSYQDTPVPFAPFIINGTFFTAIETGEWTPVYREAVADPAVAAMSAIPVEDMECSVFLLSGKLDKIWPSYDMAEVIMSRLAQNNYPHSYSHVTSEYAGHWVAFYPEYWAQVLDYFDAEYPVER